MSSQIANKGISSLSNCLLEKLLKRNLIGSIYPDSDEYKHKLKTLISRPTTVYAGFDATSDSLHVGNLATLMNLVHFQRHGHRVICVIGDATTQIGDPSGHSHDRKKIDDNTIKNNAAALVKTIKTIFNNHQLYFKPNEAQKVDMIEPMIIRNSLWYRDKNVIDFVGQVFREVRVGGLLHKKSIQERLKTNEGMNMSEFCYQIFQAFDWLELRRRYNCRLQLGGADQAGNIYTGHDIIKKITRDTDAIGLLAPLITNTATGKKLGKSSDKAQASIWLNPTKTTPYQLYQFFHRTPDNDVENFLKVFTLLDDKNIEDLIFNRLKKSDDIWFCQRKLAENVCQLIHGDSGLNSAKRLTHTFFHKNPEDIAALSDSELYQLFEQDSIIQLVHRNTLTVLDLVRKANCFNDDMDAERLISAGGLWLNGHRVTSFNVPITTDLIIGNGVTVMRAGKKNYYLFKWNK